MQSVFKLPVGIVVKKLVDEASFHQPSRHHYSSRVCGWSPILKEIKGDRGQFTVQYLLQRSLETVIQRRMRWSGWSVDLSHGYFRQDEHS